MRPRVAFAHRRPDALSAASDPRRTARDQPCLADSTVVELRKGSDLPTLCSESSPTTKASAVEQRVTMAFHTEPELHSRFGSATKPCGIRALDSATNEYRQ